MQFVVEDLPEHGAHFSGEVSVDLSAYQEVDELSVDDPVSYDLAVSRFGSTVTFKGSLEAAVSATCSRCARGFAIPVSRAFEAAYVTTEVGETDRAVELDENDLDLDYYQDGVIDGIRLLAEQIFLDIPMKVLCAEDCKGLCLQCGVNLNNEACDCEPEVDPRLATLKNLRDQL